MNYKQRLLFELIDLTTKRVRLEKFIKYNKVVDEEIMKRQLSIMLEYEGILTERLIKILESED